MLSGGQFSEPGDTPISRGEEDLSSYYDNDGKLRQRVIEKYGFGMGGPMTHRITRNYAPDGSLLDEQHEFPAIVK